MTKFPLLGDEQAGPWWRVVSLPAPGPPGPAVHDFANVLPAALTAARQGRPFVAGWLCRGEGAPLELITNAGPVVPGDGARPVPSALRDGARPVPSALLFPPGARGVPAGDWLTACGRLVWSACPARQAPASGGEPGAAAGADHGRPARFESALTALLGRPFGWLVVAVPDDGLEAELAGLRTEVNALRPQDAERSRFGAQRAAERLAELDSFREAGLWQVRVLAGAASPGDLALAAPVLAGSVELARHPYRLAPGRDPAGLADALAATVDDPASGARVPFAATAGVLAALAGLPGREVPGVRMLTPGHFDLTSETEERLAAAGEDGGRRGQRSGISGTSGGNRAAHGDPDGVAAGGGPGPAAVCLGVILDGLDRPAGEFRVPLATLNRHALITGATGAGKSQTVRHLLEQLTGAGIGWLVIEPVKSEYAGMAGRIAGSGQVTVINPADPAAIPVSVNPLAPEPGYPVQAHIDLVRALFLAAFDADEPFPQVIAQALERVYEENGWDMVTGGAAPGTVTPPAAPTLAQLQRAAAAVIDEVGYGRELRADVRGFVDVRLRSLRIGSAGRFFEGGHPASIGGLLSGNVVLAIEDIANDEDKAFLMGTLVIRVTEHLRLAARAGRAGGLRHVIVIEEAHRLLRARRAGRASAHAVELFASLLAEIRAYGEGLVIAEQIPAKLIPDVIKNTALKVVHRLPARDDRELAGAAMNLDESQSRQVVSLPPGEAAVFADGMDRPLRIRVPFGGDREREMAGPSPPLAGRRAASCGPRCRGERACTLVELHRAEILADPASPGGAWLRLWAETLALAFLTSSGLPAVPDRLAQCWAALDERLRDCLLAGVLDRVIGLRARALRDSYAPDSLSATAAAVAARILGGGPGAGVRAGPSWVIPQLRWLHEMERMRPLGAPAPRPGDRAPPLDFDLPGITDWPGMRAAQRITALLGHPLSMALPHNQQAAWTALLGEDDQAVFTADLAIAGVGLTPQARLRHVAGLMSVSGWLEAVLSWPRRFVAGLEPPLALPVAEPVAGLAPAGPRGSVEFRTRTPAG